MAKDQGAAAQHTPDALQHSYDLLNKILHGVKDGIMAFAPEGDIIFANRMAAHLLGSKSADELMRISSAEIISQFELFSPEGKKYAREEMPISRALHGEAADDKVFRIRMKATGENRWAVIRAEPVLGKNGAIQFVIVIFRDITEERHSEELLHKNQQRLQFLAEISDSLASSINYEETLKTIASRMVPGLADWAAIDMLRDDRSVERLAVVHINPEKVQLAYEMQKEFPYTPEAQTGLARVLRTGKSEFLPVISQEMIHAAVKDKRRLDLLDALQLHSYIIVPLTARGRTLGALTLVMAESRRQYDEEDVKFAEDIARRAAMAVDNARLYRDAQKALTIRDDFLSIASHELKTPVTSIKAFLQALENRMKSPEKFDFQKNRQYMQLSIKQIDRLAAIINDLLDINRINKGRMEYHFKVLPIGPVLSDAIERMCVSFPSHKLHMKLGELTANVRIDELRFEQALTNLITNAAKYSPEGSTIDIVTRSDERNVFIDIVDRGMGISAEDQAKIFTRYYRTPEAVQARVSGLGVGLYISSELIEAHHGVLTVKSNLGEGSTFTIMLPKAEGA